MAACILLALYALMSALDAPELHHLGGGGTRCSRHLVSTEEGCSGSVIFIARKLMLRNMIGLRSSMERSQDFMFNLDLNYQPHGVYNCSKCFICMRPAYLKTKRRAACRGNTILLARDSGYKDSSMDLSWSAKFMRACKA